MSFAHAEIIKTYLPFCVPVLLDCSATAFPSLRARRIKLYALLSTFQEKKIDNWHWVSDEI